MTNPNPGSLIRRLADDLEGITEELVIPEYAHTEKERTDASLALVAEARAYLAQSEPEAPTDEALLAIAAASIDPYQHSGIAIGEYEPETERAVEVYGSELIAYGRAVLAHPVPTLECNEDYWRRDALESLLHAATRYKLNVYGVEELQIYEDRARKVLARWGK